MALSPESERNIKLIYLRQDLVEEYWKLDQKLQGESSIAPVLTNDH